MKRKPAPAGAGHRHMMSLILYLVFFSYYITVRQRILMALGGGSARKEVGGIEHILKI